MIAKSSNRVNRGGSWNNHASNCRSANRNRNDPSNRNNNLGFRLLLNSAEVESNLKFPTEQIAFLADSRCAVCKPKSKPRSP